MPNCKQLSIPQRAQIVLLNSQGMSQCKIAKMIKCSRCAVQTTLKRFKETGTYENKAGRGRKKITTPREDRLIVKTSLKNRKLTSKMVKDEIKEQHHIMVSARTIRRRLVDVNLKGRKARKKPLLTEAQRKKRLSWAKKYRHWTEEDWAKVIWSDESNVEIFGQPGSQFVRRRIGEEYSPDCIIPTVKFGGGSIMIWGCMSTQGVGEVFLCTGRMNSDTYISMLTEILEPSALKLFDSSDPQYIFQQDNAPCHTSKKAMGWFLENKVTVLEWPPQSPDLSPIEHLWPIIKQNIGKHHCTSKEQLISAIKIEWNLISKNFCAKLINSMPRRIKSVIKARGGSTKY